MGGAAIVKTYLLYNVHVARCYMSLHYSINSRVSLYYMYNYSLVPIPLRPSIASDKTLGSEGLGLKLTASYVHSDYAVLQLQPHPSLSKRFACWYDAGLLAITIYTSHTKE